MAEYAKRSEVTIETMGKVHNPTGEGVRAVSSLAQAKAAKVASKTEEYETKVKEGTAKRNITRKKSADTATNYNSTHKKQGGHGKGLWKEEMEYAMDDANEVVDEKDPLYDETKHSKFILTSAPVDTNSRRGYDPETSKPIYGPLLTKQEFKIQLTDILKEYFDSSDADEVIRSVQELGCPEYHAEIVKKAVSLALDKGPRERELTSRLLTCLHPVPLTSEHMLDGFDALLDALPDLETDVPEAAHMVACFLARAVVDEVVPPKFLSHENNHRPGDAVLAKAMSLLNREHSTARLERVWGPGDGRPVEELKREMDQLLQEYLLSRELDEAARCVKELDARHFHHELVKRGVILAMEMDGKPGTSEDNLDAMAALFGFLVRNAIVSDNQVKKGIGRLHQLLPDISLDVPAAPKLLTDFEAMALDQDCLPKVAARSSDLVKVQEL